MATTALASLTGSEQRALDRLLSLLEADFGEDLRAVWLYGSRARGDAHDESDIDLLVILAAPDRGQWERVQQLRARAAEREGIEPTFFSAMVGSPEWLAKRRAIEAFYIQEVDRDKIVLWGGEFEAPEPLTGHEEHGPVRERTREYLQQAHTELEEAGRVRHSSSVVAHAYYVVVNAATAALSEEDRFVRTHSGMWALASELLVLTGKLPADLQGAAAALQPAREKAVYAPPSPDDPWIKPTRAQADAALETARRYLAAVEELLGVAPAP